MFDTKESRLQDLLVTHTSTTASAELKERVENMARFTSSTSFHKRAHAKRIRFAILSSSTAVVIVGSVALGPSLVAANTLGRVTAAIDGTTSMHFRMFKVSDGANKLEYEQWYKGGVWRFERPGQTTVWQDGHSFTYTPSNNTVIKQNKADGPFSNNVNSFKMSSLIDQLAGKGGRRDVVKTTIDDHKYRLQVDNKPVEERYQFVVNAKTDLPETMEVFKPENGRWILKGRGYIEFDRAFAASLFAPPIPPGAIQIDLDAYKAKLSDQFKQTRATMHLSTGASMIIRDIQANDRGHVFMTYTGNAGAPFNSYLRLTDENGNAYVKADYAGGYMVKHPLQLASGSSVNYEWWIPTVDLGKFRPHRLTLSSFKAKTKRGPKPDSFYFYGYEKSGETTFETIKPTTHDVPLYLPILGEFDVPKSDLDVRYGEAISLSSHFEHQWVDKNGNPLNDNGWNYSTLSTGNHHAPGALETAFKMALEQLDLAADLDKEQGEGGRVATANFNLFRLSRLLGRTAESDAYLAKATHQDGQYVKQASDWLKNEKQMGNLP